MTQILDQEERETMAEIVGIMRRIHSWNLRGNQGELIGHIHGLQTFVTQRALQRLSPDEFSQWYGPSKEAES